ncbi:MarR family transcriptional regulator [Marinimicrobium locisalis]|uniref:HVO_A0114 family putative DNA-binding protein n=1 Tax=Marinimicrobium locisalis TaxID=546022 RepID=UPI00322185AC
MKAKIGVMREDLIRKRLLAIAQGTYKPLEDEPKVWYASFNAISRILCQENIDLLRMIAAEKPETVTELAELSGRAKSNLSKTLKSLSDKGFVRLEPSRGKTLRPVAIYTDFEIISSSEIENRVCHASLNKDVA